MSEPIKTTDITGKPFWAIQEAFGKPITAFQMAAILNAAIKHGIVSPPAEINCEDDGTPFRDEYGRVFIRPAGQEPAIPGPWVHWRGER